MVRQLGQRLRIGDADTYGDAGATKYLGTDPPAECVKFANPSEVGEGFVYLKERCQPMDMSEAHANSSFPLNTP